MTKPTVLHRNVRFKLSLLVMLAGLLSAIGVYIIFRSHASGIPGDANGDGVVNILDLSILASHWGNSGASFSQGDFNGDGTVNILDLSALATNWGNTSSVINATPTGPAAPASGWHVALADDFNATLGTGVGQDNFWYPSQTWNANPGTDANGNNGYETEVYNSSQVSVSNGNLVLGAQYQNDRAPALGDGSGNGINNAVQRNYVAGLVTSPTSGHAGYSGFTWTPDGGETWAFEIVCQWPVDTGELFNAWWTSGPVGGWENERDFLEGHHNSQIDTDWIYQTPTNGGKLQNYYLDSLDFDPATAMHRYTYVVFPNQSWSFYIDGVLQTWVGTNGVAPAQTGTNVPMDLLINYALDATTFTSGTRQFLIDSVAVYEDAAHAGQDVTGGGIAPGTAVPGY